MVDENPLLLLRDDVAIVETDDNELRLFLAEVNFFFDKEATDPAAFFFLALGNNIFFAELFALAVIAATAALPPLFDAADDEKDPDKSIVPPTGRGVGIHKPSVEYRESDLDAEG